MIWLGWAIWTICMLSPFIAMWYIIKKNKDSDHPRHNPKIKFKNSKQ